MKASTLVAQHLRASLLRFLKFTDAQPADALVQRRYDRFRRIGVFSTQALGLAPEGTLSPPRAERGAPGSVAGL